MEHVDAGFEDVSVRGVADIGDVGHEFVEEADPVGWVIVCYYGAVLGERKGKRESAFCRYV